ncbi:ribulose-phosphate 3-epimerase [Enterococcus sp. AZ072]|uniref:ribulose-phosphate 3-epimerase n=1 Tax=unclassified Enterococcus TaxID=2608891 RepID=UPI003D26B620
MLVAPSILSADFRDLKSQLEEVEAGGADWIHFDVFDGNFVKNISFGVDVLKAVKKVSNLLIDVHLVITDPEYFVDVFMDAGADSITFHLDSMNDVDRSMALVKKIKARGKQVGVTISPEIDTADYLPFLPYVDIALVMSIVPGFGGQPFQDSALEKIAWLKNQRLEHGYSYIIQVDGGINQTTGMLCKEAGADCLVAGSFVFGDNMAKAIQSLK